MLAKPTLLWLHPPSNPPEQEDGVVGGRLKRLQNSFVRRLIRELCLFQVGGGGVWVSVLLLHRDCNGLQATSLVDHQSLGWSACM